MTFDAEGVRARLAAAKTGSYDAEEVLASHAPTDLAAALDRIAELEAENERLRTAEWRDRSDALEAEGARLATERGLAGEGT